MNSDNLLLQEVTAVQGSPEWFYAKAQTKEMLTDQINVEKIREDFVAKFSPEKLSTMDENELLKNVFGLDSSSMMSFLSYANNTNQCFGIAMLRKNLSVVYQSFGVKGWYYWNGTNSKIISEQEAKVKAVYVRDALLRCVNEIKRIGDFQTVYDYIALQKTVDKEFFLKYAPFLSYFQMVYPQFFPCICSENRITRVLRVLGIPSHAKKIVKIGEISLFIRRCGVNSVIFYRIFEDEWGWESSIKKCQNAEDNASICKQQICNNIPVSYGNLSIEEAQQKIEGIVQADEIEQSLNQSLLTGKDREAVVKARVNQGVFRERLLGIYSHCCLCGVSNKTLLTASHIKPWKASDSTEKLDENNGLLLCPNHDKLFDKGFISFDQSGKIMISEELSEEDAASMGINKDMKLSVTIGQSFFLNYHRAIVFKNPIKETKENKT